MLKLAEIFQDYMTLQRQKPVRIWGSSDCAQSLSVSLNGLKLVQDVQVDGEFSLFLPQQEAMTDAELTITGTVDSLTLSHVDIGEVWIAGGQSNMEFLLRYDEEGKEQIQNANDPHLRFFDVGEYTFSGEKEQTHKDNSEAWDRWISFQPDTAEYFSAVGVYFAKQLRKAYNVPVAIVGCNWGGTTASAWIAESYLEKNPALKVYLDEYRAATKDINMDEYIQKHTEALAFLDSKELVDAMRKVMYGNVRVWEYIKAIPLIFKISRNGMPIGPRNQNSPGCLYRSMVSQIAGLSCRGVIWYQGESDDVKADIYDKLFSAMIRCWRDAWHEELPFLFVQLAPFGTWLGGNGERFPTVRQRQEYVSKHVPGTYMVSIMDVGNQKDIHPKKKHPVGDRLALLARNKIYGESILCDAPEFASMEQDNGTLTLRFSNAGDGLTIKGKKLQALELYVNGKALKAYGADAQGNAIYIRSTKIRKDSTIKVAFAWTGYCEVNLYNSAGLPAKPFKA